MENMISGNRRHIPDLFSFGIVCYRNWEYMKETIDSVLLQDYEKIQLIVSDDGSDRFPTEEFEQYIASHKGDNIVSYVVRHSEKNEGTVRHLNHVLDCVEGEYIMLMAADDTLDNSRVLSRFVQALKREGDDCGVAMGQTALYDITMSNLLDYYVWPDVIDAINKEDNAKTLLEALYYYPCIPTTSTCFRRWVMDQYAPFDTDYKLIEDYPFHIKLAENNVKMHYENFVAARHRDGGISHGAVTALSRSKQMYYEDCILARKSVRGKLLETKGDDNLLRFNTYQIAAHERILMTAGKKRIGFLHYAMKYPQYAILGVSARANKRRTVKWGIMLVSFLILQYLVPECAFLLSALFPFVTSETLYAVLPPLFTVISILIGAIMILELILLWASRCSRYPAELVDLLGLGRE